MTVPHPARRIALLAPMPSELRPLIRKLSLRPSTLGDTNVHTGTLGDVEIVATSTGMGTVAAATTAEQILDATDIDHLCVVGIAGGLEPGVAIGTVAVPAAVIDHSTGREHRPAPIGESVAAGKVLTSDALLGNDVLDGYREQGVIAVDMETAAIAAVCERHQCPWSAFRAISDRTSDGTVNDGVFALAKPDGSPNLPAAARYILARPWRIPGLVRLARDATVAANAAADAAIRALTPS